MFHLEVSCTNSYTKLKLYNICFTCNIVFHNIVHSDGVLYYLLTDYMTCFNPTDMSLEDSILRNFGGPVINNLNHI